ncbi:hypothetical protein LCL99_13460 [Halomonas denitrificans]|uniref:hypothetical protein n=1 Tax=Halomonas denitrificans TaxID=370769 RepID=UPI001CD289AD|nr:hypothetical protein [Halomonas denitrificans]MCA0975478.1 hypothetical protein [Halomonas denitrificans]
MSLHGLMMLLEPTLLSLGLLAVMVAYYQYYRRTRDLWGMVKFWEKRLTLTVSEHAWQRFGILLLLLGVVARYLLALQVV